MRADRATGFPDIATLLEEQAKAHPDRLSILSEDGDGLSYAELHRRASDGAGVIAGAAREAGIAARPRVGIVLPNGAGISVAMLAAAIAGEATPLNPRLTAPEIARLIEVARIDMMLVGEAEDGPAARMAEAAGIPLLRTDAAHRLSGAKAAPHAPPGEDDIALVLMTSGSTGVPKIVPLSHRNVCRSADDVARSVTLSPDDRCLTMWEQFHVGGLVDLLLAPLASGGEIVATSGFDARKFFPLVERLKPTWYQGVPTTLGELLAHAESAGLETGGTSLRFVRSVAAALRTPLMARIEAAFGVPVIRTLGMTEAGPLITSTALPPAPQKPGSVGRPAGPEVGIFAPDGTVLPQGETGEVGVRGENVFTGYEANPEANAAAFRNGWLMTGDLGHFDEDGDLFLTGRIKEQINRGGFKISPAEVEEAIAAYPDVEEVAVFAVPHPTLSEDVVAAVSLRAPVEVAAIREHLQERLAPYKIPARISVHDSLPRNPVGKVDKLALTEHAMSHAQADRTAPVGTTQLFLAELWRRELHVDAVGTGEDFFAAGGDSLSAMRILMAVENALGKTVPDALMDHFNTIAEFATALEGAGLAISDGEGDAVAQADAAIAGTEHGSGSLEGGIEAVVEAVGKAGSKERVQAALEIVTAYEAPADILDLLEPLRAGEPGALAEPRPNKPALFLLRRRYDKLLQELEDEIFDVVGYESWVREPLSDGLWLYGDGSGDGRGKTLIAGFSGNLMRLQLPTYRFLLALDPAHHDLMLLRDRRKALFAQGLDGVGNSISEVADHVDRFARTRGYDRVIALGTSGGSLAAVQAAVLSGWARGIAASVPPLERHPALGAAIREVAPRHDPEVTEIIVANALSGRDEGPARELLAVLPGARHQEMAQYNTHNILNSAHRAGKLGALFDQWFSP